MSIRRKNRKKEGGAMPSTGAGLMRYFDEELPGIKIGPNAVLVYTGMLILTVLLANTPAWPF